MAAIETATDWFVAERRTAGSGKTVTVVESACQIGSKRAAGVGCERRMAWLSVRQTRRAAPLCAKRSWPKKDGRSERVTQTAAAGAAVVAATVGVIALSAVMMGAALTRVARPPCSRYVLCPLLLALAVAQRRRRRARGLAGLMTAVAEFFPAGSQQVDASVVAGVVPVATTVAGARLSPAPVVKRTRTAVIMTVTRTYTRGAGQVAQAGGMGRLQCRSPVVFALLTEGMVPSGCRAPPTAALLHRGACRRCHPELPVAAMVTVGTSTTTRPIAPMPNGPHDTLRLRREAAARTTMRRPLLDLGRGCPLRRPVVLMVAVTATAVASLGLGVGDVEMVVHHCCLVSCGHRARTAAVTSPPVAMGVCLMGAPAPIRGRG